MTMNHKGVTIVQYMSLNSELSLNNNIQCVIVIILLKNILKYMYTVFINSGLMLVLYCKCVSRFASESILGYCVQWNTNSKHCYVAQEVLSLLLHSVPPDIFLQQPNARQVLEGLLPYTGQCLILQKTLLSGGISV